MDYKDQVGFLTLAQNSSTNYLELAYLQALSIKLTMPNYKYAVIVDDKTMNVFQDYYWDAIDYVIPLQIDYTKDTGNPFLNECQVLQLTPFKETIRKKIFSFAEIHCKFFGCIKFCIFSSK